MSANLFLVKYIVSVVFVVILS